MINGGSASTTCFDKVMDRRNSSKWNCDRHKEPNSLPNFTTPPAKPWASCRSNCDNRSNGADRYEVQPTRMVHVRSRVMHIQWLISGMTKVSIVSPSLAHSVNESTHRPFTPAVCSIIKSPTAGWAAHFLSPGTCTVLTHNSSGCDLPSCWSIYFEHEGQSIRG
jgi:hypothetical protein